MMLSIQQSMLVIFRARARHQLVYATVCFQSPPLAYFGRRHAPAAGHELGQRFRLTARVDFEACFTPSDQCPFAITMLTPKFLFRAAQSAGLLLNGPQARGEHGPAIAFHTRHVQKRFHAGYTLRDFSPRPRLASPHSHFLSRISHASLAATFHVPAIASFG